MSLPLQSTLVIGRLPYLNVLPFFAGDTFKQYPITVADPRTLGLSLRVGNVSAAPIPIVDLWRFSTQINPLEDFGIATQVKANSVLLFSKQPPETLNESPIVVTTESSTSVRLLWLLLREQWGIETPQLVRETSSEQARLLIGDAALTQRRRLEQAGYIVYDLAEIWYRLTGYSFVFAQWATHHSIGTAICQELSQSLQEALERNLMDLSALYQPTEHTFLTREQLVAYLSQFIYQFSSAEREGMKYFKTKVLAYGLLDTDL